MKRELIVCVALVVVASACASSDSAATGALSVAREESVWRRDVEVGLDGGVSTGESPGGDRDEIHEAFEWLMIGRVQCGRRPRDCVVDDLAVPGSSVHTSLTVVIDERVRYGIYASGEGSHRYHITEVIQVDDDRAEVRSCHTDDVVLRIGGAGDRPSAVYDESLVSHWSTWSLQRDENGWRWTDEIVGTRSYGKDVCHS